MSKHEPIEIPTDLWVDLMTLSNSLSFLAKTSDFDDTNRAAPIKIDGMELQSMFEVLNHQMEKVMARINGD